MTDELLKRCTQCEETKPWSAFNMAVVTSGKKRPRPECKDCVAGRRFLRVYGMSLAEYREKLADQRGLCAICQEEQRSTPKRVTRLAIDHDHETGENRDLLCNGCNRLLGFSDDRIDILEAAIKYLRKWGK